MSAIADVSPELAEQAGAPARFSSQLAGLCGSSPVTPPELDPAARGQCHSAHMSVPSTWRLIPQMQQGVALYTSWDVHTRDSLAWSACRANKMVAVAACGATLSRESMGSYCMLTWECRASKTAVPTHRATPHGVRRVLLCGKQGCPSWRKGGASRALSSTHREKPTQTLL